MEIHICDNFDEIAGKSLRFLKGPKVALSGGSTYKALFDFWAKQPALAKIEYYPVDERCVPMESPDSNWGVATEHFFKPQNIEFQKENGAKDLAQYEELLREKIGKDVVFDQIFLGMGEDGHTASLFPGGEYLDDEFSIVLKTTSPKAPFERITLGFRPLWECKSLILIATGENKAKKIRQLMDGDMSLPVTKALKGHPKPIIILDKAASSLIYS